MRLTPAEVSAIAGGKDVRTLTRLDAQNKGITQVLDLDACNSLKGVNLSKNKLTSATFLAEMKQLVWLNVSENNLTTLDGVQELSKVKVLNASRNRLTSLAPVASLRELNALIVNDNQLRDVGNLKELLKLNTLVLSRNQIEDLGQSLRHLLELSKLSCTNNKLVSLGRSLKRNTMLSQLRLSHNRLQAMPPELSNNGQLKLLDIGYNQIKDIAALKVLQELPQLQTLTVAGNPLCRAEDYWERVIAFLPQIEKLDDRLIPGRGKIKRTAKIHLEGEYGSKVSEKIKRKAASLRREKKLEKAKPKVHTSARQDDNNGSISDPLKDKPKKEKGNKRRKLDGRHVVVDNNGDEKETSAQEVAAGEGEEKMSKGGTGVLKIWTKGGGLETTSAKNQEILAKQLTGSTIGLGGSNAWDDEEDAGPPTNPGLVDVDTNGGTTRSVRAIVTDHRALPVTTYSRWALKKNK